MDGLTPVRSGVIQRLLHDPEMRRPIVIRVAQLSSGNVLFGAWGPHRGACHWGIERMRRALWVDLDLRPFHDRFRDDELIGSVVRADPTLRPGGRPDPFEALAWAVTEQLIEYERAVRIQRRIVRSLGRMDAASGLLDAPAAATIAGTAPALFESFDLSGGRSLALVHAAREVARGRVELWSDDPAIQEVGWRRLRMIPGVGSWTIEMLALVGQGRLDQVPAGDLGFIKLAGRLLSGGDPQARGTEDDVRALLDRFGEWKGIAGAYALRAGGSWRSPIVRA
jgi:3-methyladenine DNA glycosylase/8-oxoguanine DNA glycosylase